MPRSATLRLPARPPATPLDRYRAGQIGLPEYVSLSAAARQGHPARHQRPDAARGFRLVIA